MSLIKPSINIVIPLYNEEDNFDILVDRINKVIDNADVDIEVILVDDGSIDSTSFKMSDLSSKDSRYHSVFLSRNFGHQIALTAGFDFVNASEAVMVIDGDLQDPPELFDELYNKFLRAYH